jgi:hypothetical protein
MWPAQWGGSSSKEPWGRRALPMTNRIAIALASLLLLALILDRALNQGAALLFMAKKFLVLIDWLEFWR